VEILLQGIPNKEYLRTFLAAKGFQVKEGAPVPDSPLQRLCVSKDGDPVERVEVVALLRQNKEFELPDSK
jgi:hypothetical protein